MAARFISSFENITYTSQTGATITPLFEDTVIIYSSTNGTTWEYVADSYTSGVVWSYPAFPPPGDPTIRAVTWDDFPSDEYIKIKILPGSCPNSNCSSIVANEEDYDLFVDDVLFDWSSLGTMIDSDFSPTGNDLGHYSNSDFRETLIEGCTDEYALNYLPEATDDDGSCEYDEVSFDINNDGDSNILDVVQTVEIVLNEPNPSLDNYQMLDLNNDNTINVLDVILMVSFILGRIGL